MRPRHPQVALAVLAGLFFAAPSGAEPPRPSSITVLGDRGFRPFHFMSHGRCSGILVDLWALWSEKAGIPVTFNCDLDWATAVASVRQGKADVIGGIIKTPEREAQFDFAGNVITTYFHLYFHTSLGALKDVDSLPDSTPIGVVKEDYPEGVLRRTYPAHSIKTYDDHDALIDAALRKDVLVFVLEPEVAEYYFAIKGQIPPPFKKSAEPFLEERLDAGVRKTGGATAYWVSYGLKRITAQERAAILRRWNYGTTTYRFRVFREEVQRHPYIATSAIVVLGYLITLSCMWLFSQLRPLSCLEVERFLRNRLKFTLTLGATKFELSLRGILLLELFTYRAHVIDSWMRSVTPRVRKNFAAISTALRPTTFTPLPVFIDNTLVTADDPAELETKLKSIVRSTVTVGRIAILISGEGGAGKTATALRFIEWICKLDEDSADCPVFPAILEADLEFEADQAGKAIPLAVQGVIAALTEDIVDAELTQYLVQERRICVLLDGISERAERTRRGRTS